MIAPCHECTHRTVIPNCHSTCEAYQSYSAERERIRAQRQLDRTGDEARIRRRIKIKEDERRNGKR